MLHPDFNPFRSYWWKKSGDPVEDMTEAAMLAYGNALGWDEDMVRGKIKAAWDKRQGVARSLTGPNT